MGVNAGAVLENYLHKQAITKGYFTIKNSKGKRVQIGRNIQEVQTGGIGGTKCKFDLKVGNDFAMQVKSGAGHSATVFGARLEAILACGKREYFDAEPVKVVYAMAKASNKRVKLSEHFNLSEWSDLLYYFLYTGTAGSQEIKTMQANKLVYLSKQGELTIFDRTEGIEFLWSKLYAEVRVKSGQEIVAIRIMN